MVVLDSNIELHPRRWQIIQAFLVSDATLRLDQAPSGKLVWVRRTWEHLGHPVKSVYRWGEGGRLVAWLLTEQKAEHETGSW